MVTLKTLRGWFAVGAAGAVMVAPSHAAGQSTITESPGMLAAVRDHVARSAEGPVAFDPRPLREGFDATRIRDSTDLIDSIRLVHGRQALAREISLATADLTADRRCTFLVGEAPMPGRVTSADGQRRSDECQRRGRFTTFAMTIPRPQSTAGERATRARTRVAVFTGGGYAVWELTLESQDGRAWRVDQAERVFVIWA
jgi:hypothetical protein